MASKNKDEGPRNHTAANSGNNKGSHIRQCCAQGQRGKFITNAKMLKSWKNEECNPSKEAATFNTQHSQLLHQFRLET